MAVGIIYVMTTCVDGLVKIGKTGSNNFEQRMSEIERNGYHRISVLNREFAIEVNDFDAKEKLLHELFSKSRVGDSELFSVDVNLVKQLMSSMDGRVVYPEGESKSQVFELATEIVESRSGMIPNGIYHLKQKSKRDNSFVYGELEVNDGKLILKKGSKIAEISSLSVKGWKASRNNLSVIDNITQEDLECDSPSMASSIVVGHNSNGWDLWLNSQNEKINIYRNYDE